MSKCSINFLSGTAPLVSPLWPVALDGAVQGKSTRKGQGILTPTHEGGWDYGKKLSRLTEIISISCTRAEPFMLTSAEKSIFLLLSLGFALVSHEPNTKPGETGFNMYANIWNPPKRGWHMAVSHCTTLHVRTHCHSHVEQRFPSFHYHNWQKTVLKMKLTFWNGSAFVPVDLLDCR